MGTISPRKIFSLLAYLFLAACDLPSGSDPSEAESTASAKPEAHLLATPPPASCTSNDVQVVDLHSDFRDIWAGRETVDTGKQADPSVSVVVDFSTTIDPARIAAQFVPVVNGGSCGDSVAATSTGSVVPPNVWGVPARSLAEKSSQIAVVELASARGGQHVSRFRFPLGVRGGRETGAENGRVVRRMAGVYDDGGART
jgi:hypothetical protein